MSRTLKEIYIDKSNSNFKNYCFTSTGSEEGNYIRIENLSQINIFIGANNSGKSRFLRNIFKSMTSEFNLVRPVDQLIWGENVVPSYNELDFTYFDVDPILRAIKENEINVHNSLKDKENINELNEGLEDIRNRLLSKNLYKNGLSFRQFRECRNELNSLYVRIGLKEFNSDSNKEFTVRGVSKIEHIYDKFEIIIREMEKTYHKGANDIKFKTTYIPSLRSLRDVSGQQLKNRTLKDYFEDDETFKASIFSGENIYDKVRDLYMGHAEDHQKLKNFEDFLSKYFFRNEHVKITAPKLLKDKTKGNEHLHITIGKEKERIIYDIGDGIQAIIILTFPLFEQQGNRHVVFMEEPELYLHPGLQRVLIDTLKDDVFPNLQVFMTTHSNHFLDLTMEETGNISIYTFKKNFKVEGQTDEEVSFTIENVSNPDTSVLDLIGVRNSSVFLSNCTIWVEGITDRLYIRKFFELYQKQLHDDAKEKNLKFEYLLEDIHYSFVEYGGSNITHWSFLDDGDDSFKESYINVERLCGKLFLVADKDAGKGKKKERNFLLEKKLGERYFQLKVREIENLLIPEVIVKTLESIQKKGQNLDFEFNTFEYLDYTNEYLGRFIDEKVFKNKQKKKFADSSGTLNNKLIFAQIATSKMNSVKDLSPDAKELAEKIYTFIASRNN